MKIDPANLASVARQRRLGFRGLHTVADLRREGISGLPAEPGAYLVLRGSTSSPGFSKQEADVSVGAEGSNRPRLAQVFRRCTGTHPKKRRLT